MSGHIGKFVKGLPEELGAGQSPMHPGVLSTALSNRCDTRKRSHFFSRVKAFSLGTHGHQEPGSQGWTGARETIEEFPFRMGFEQMNLMMNGCANDMTEISETA